MKLLRLKKLTRARMEQWLLEHPRKIFNTKDARRCPVHAYLQSSYPKATVHTVGTTGGNIETSKSPIDWRRFHLPVWARKFIDRIDRSSSRSVRITGKQSLDILTSI